MSRARMLERYAFTCRHPCGECEWTDFASPSRAFRPWRRRAHADVPRELICFLCPVELWFQRCLATRAASTAGALFPQDPRT
jgi:hypothetical protein